MTTGPSAAESRRRLLELIQGCRVTQVLYAAPRLWIAEALRAGPRAGRELAAAVGAHVPSLVWLLRVSSVLASSDWAPTAGTASPTRAPCSTGSTSDRCAGIFLGGSKLYPHWGDLVGSVRAGQTRTSGAMASMRGRTSVRDREWG